MSGWPSTIREVSNKIQPHWTFREKLTVEGGIVLKGTHIVISHKKHQATLNRIQEGHLGLNKYMLRAKDTVLARLEWSAGKVSAELWTVFQVFSFQAQAEAKYISWTENTSASLDQACHWHFPFESAPYVLIVDYTSWFSVVHKLSLMTGPHVANQCKLIFPEYGWPETLISDNGYAIHHKPSPVLCSLTAWIILPALCITCSQMVLLKHVQLSRACSTKLKKKAKIFISVLWFITILPYR